MKKRSILLILLLCLAMGFAGCGEEPVSSGQPVSSGPVSGDPVSSDPVSSDPEDMYDPDTGIYKGLLELYQQNSDLVGYITIPGTKLDMPVMQGEDNDFYLNHNWLKEIDVYGTPFIDWRSTIMRGYQSHNITIYGHNSKKGEYFECVKYYSDMDYYKEHPFIQFDTIAGPGEYVVIGRFTENIRAEGFFYYHEYRNVNEADFNEFLRKLDERNYYETDIDVTYGDLLLTLSTCNDDIAGSFETPYRDVLVARKLRPGEKITVEEMGIRPNTDMIMPTGWVKKYGKDNPWQQD